MTRIFLFSMIFGFLLGYSVRGHAAEVSAVANYGPSSLSDDEAPEMKTGGNFREILGMLNRSGPRWNFAAGVGFFASDLSGTDTSSSTGSGLGLRSYSRTVSGEVARLAARYRLTDHLEGGLSTDLLFGTDVSFSSNLFESGSNTAWLVGAEFLYGFELGGARLRAGPRYFASLGLSGRKLDALQGVLETDLVEF